MITLKQSIDIMNRIKDNHTEVEIYIDSSKGKPHFVIEEQVITLSQGGYHGTD